MVLPYLLIFIYFTILSFIKGSNILYRKIKYPFSLSVILILIATFRPEEMNDFLTYKDLFNNNEFHEPGYFLLQSLVKNSFNEVRVLFFLMALISVTLNLYAIKKFSNFIYLSIIFYLANLYILHDLIQIRCAVAASLFLFAIPEIYRKNFKKFILIIIICTLFHYSSLAFIPLYFLNSKLKNNIYYYLVPIAYVFYFLNIKIGFILGLLHIPIISDLWNLYQIRMNVAGIGNDINVFNIFQLIKCSICFILILFNKRISFHNKYFILWLKIYIISLITFVLFSDIPVVAFRISELLQTVEFLLFPLLMYLPIKNGTQLKKIFTLGIGYIIMFITVFYCNYLL